MIAFVFAALAEIAIGLFIRKYYLPNKPINMLPFLQKWLKSDRVSVVPEEYIIRIKKANDFVLKFCVGMGIITILNGVIHQYFNVIDLKEYLIGITVVAIFPLRFLYIAKKS